MIKVICPKCEARVRLDRNMRGEVETQYDNTFESCREVNVRKIVDEGGRVEKCPEMERAITTAITRGRL